MAIDELELLSGEPTDAYFVECFFQDLPQEKTASNLLMLGDCQDKLKLIPSNSIDLVLVDLPYGVSQNEWDIPISLDFLWTQYDRIIKEAGNIIFTATQPFTSLLVTSNLKFFKYEMIWEKTIGSGQLNIKRQPLRSHESILVFYKKLGTYNEQLTPGKPYSIKRKITHKGKGYGQQKDSSKINSGFRHARSVIKISNPRVKNGHSTQKPLELMDLLIKTYSNEHDVIIDHCMGSGVAGVSAKRLNRHFIGVEKDPAWFNKAKEWINGI